ncbi:transcription elongation factor S-II [Nematocida homosporus]|uniref:transcription elongation factor S-II n=1 Tax=Nematocida homosporus TaxID=1912981 RepID=UPI002221003A|nr:transcription elongation factor S-II [Nematocida homosporus]KAI5184929.1 transcription elongation factor S-II [Nematocida homosporus]
MDNSETRTRCREILSKVFLERIEGRDAERSAHLGMMLEEEIQRRSDSPNEYSKLFRSKYLNLKEATNKWLCASVYNGVIDAVSFIKMSSEEMKSKELKELEAKILERSILDSTIAKQEAETDIFFCNKCKQRKCTYRQLQTRSADEPMTTYVHCVVCGNNWKFC